MSKLDSFRWAFKDKEVVPIVIGGMGVDISTAELALEAARLGGVGHISDAMVPYLSDKYFGTSYQAKKGEEFRSFRNSQDKDGVSWSVSDTYEAAKRYVSHTMSRKHGRGAVFVNVMEKLNMGAPQDTLQARLRGAMDGGIDGITLSAGLHTGTLKLIEDQPRFRDVAIGVIVSSARALKIFLRSASRVNRMPDYIVVEGPLAGGHLGFGEDWRNYNLHSIVQEVMALLKEENLQIAVIPAGGIFTSEDAAFYLDQGAAAVQVATRFTISQECGLSAQAKQEYLRAKEEDIVVNMTSPSGYPMRMLNYSPSLSSNIKPNCESLGYMLDSHGKCSYRDAYDAVNLDAKGRKLPVKDKMCICYHFMQMQCYTCGQNVYRLKDTTFKLPNGDWYLPTAEEVFRDYQFGQGINLKVESSESQLLQASSF